MRKRTLSVQYIVLIKMIIPFVKYTANDHFKYRSNSISINTTITFNKNNVNNLKWAGRCQYSDGNSRHTITNNVPDTIASNTM